MREMSTYAGVLLGTDKARRTTSEVLGSIELLPLAFYGNPYLPAVC